MIDALAAAQFGVAPALALALLRASWQGAMLAVAAALVMAALHRRSASARHAAGMIFLLAMVVVPVIDVWLSWSAPGHGAAAGLLPAQSAPRIAGLGDIGGLYMQQSAPLTNALALAWLLGVGMMLLRHFGGWRWLGVIERRPFEALPAPWQRKVAALQQAMGISRTVVVRVATDIAVPFTARLLRPVIWLPRTLLSLLPAEQLQALLAHELAHIRRMDWLWNGLQCVVESLLFFHPGVWWLSRRIRQEREHACDDLAVAACGDAIALAEALAQLERHRHPPRPALAANGGSLMQRITRLLSDPSSRARWRVPFTIGVLLVGVALVAGGTGISRHRLPNLHITSTTDGVLGPGDSRRIVAEGLDGTREYRASVDARGQLVETFSMDGKRQPIDAKARRWIAEVTRLGVPPPPPMPPMPPLPPPPPPAPDIANSRAFQSVSNLAAADARVVAALGTPVVVLRKGVAGNIDVSGWNERDRKAQFEFSARGPKGEARLKVDAHAEGDAWTLDTLEVRAIDR